MKVIPILHCINMQRALHFYTTILGFTLRYPGTTADEPVVTIINEGAEIQLSIMGAIPAIYINIEVDDVDGLFKKYLQRGLDTSAKKNSPVHQGPIDQTWGWREFYVTDPDGNTLCFRKLIS
jgi:catechol 2,3-dioxygenase-like lactoylglutathione lyase family enzyme